LPHGYAAWARQGLLLGPLRRRGLRELFASGNPAPPHAFVDYSGFQGLLASKEFRVAVALRDVSVTWDDSQGQVHFHYSQDIVPGYTPWNRWQNVPGVGWQCLNNGTYWLGAGRPFVRRSSTGTSATIIAGARVKLCWFLNLASSLFTFHLAPWAMVRL